MTVPGVGPVVALTYRATVDVPARFRKSKSVGAVFGLTPARDQSGESDRPGAISRCGDEMMRTTLYEAAQVMLLRSAKWSWLKAWAMKIARHRGMKKAIVAGKRPVIPCMRRRTPIGSACTRRSGAMHKGNPDHAAIRLPLSRQKIFEVTPVTCFAISAVVRFP